MELATLIIQSIFWTIAATVGILSYMQARKTIFQPAKNEVFKVQINDLKKILSDLNWISQSECINKSGLDESIKLNINIIFFDYIKHNFKTDLDISKGPYKFAVGGAIIDPSALKLIEGPADLSGKEKKERDKFERELE